MTRGWRPYTAIARPTRPPNDQRPRDTGRGSGSTLTRTAGSCSRSSADRRPTRGNVAPFTAASTHAPTGRAGEHAGDRDLRGPEPDRRDGQLDRAPCPACRRSRPAPCRATAPMPFLMSSPDSDFFSSLGFSAFLSCDAGFLEERVERRLALAATGALGLLVRRASRLPSVRPACRRRRRTSRPSSPSRRPSRCRAACWRSLASRLRVVGARRRRTAHAPWRPSCRRPRQDPRRRDRLDVGAAVLGVAEPAAGAASAPRREHARRSPRSTRPAARPPCSFICVETYQPTPAAAARPSAERSRTSCRLRDFCCAARRARRRSA